MIDNEELNKRIDFLYKAKDKKMICTGVNGLIKEGKIWLTYKDSVVGVLIDLKYNEEQNWEDYLYRKLSKLRKSISTINKLNKEFENENLKMKQLIKGNAIY